MQRMMIGLVAMLAGTAFAQAPAQPAARVHVKMVGSNAVKYTSKLAQVVELNFTMGNTHQPGKKVISDALDRISRTYGTGGAAAFTVKHIATSQDGSSSGEIPAFTVEDLMAGQVIVANNVGSFGDAAMGSARQQAIQRAVEAEGRGYLGFHGSGDNRDNGWPWYTNTLHPMNYNGHGSRVEAPVYRHLDQIKHVILQGILETKTVAATVPNELNGTAEAYAPNVPTRKMRNEWYRFGRDISRDPAFKDKVTTLLKYDARELGDALPPQFRRVGGNLYTYLYQVGKGVTSYIPAGHQNDELLEPSTGFDGGAGDFDRYVAQTLFFLAGYATSICDASCNGLPIVNAQNQITGQVYTVGVHGPELVPMQSGLYLDPLNPAFFSPSGRFEAVLTDVSGRKAAVLSGTGKTYHAFPTAGLKAGVYLLRVKAGGKTLSRRYLVSPRSA